MKRKKVLLSIRFRFRIVMLYEINNVDQGIYLYGRFKGSDTPTPGL